jgi:hypothetical protein
VREHDQGPLAGLGEAHADAVRLDESEGDTVDR